MELINHNADWTWDDLAKELVDHYDTEPSELILLLFQHNKQIFNDVLEWNCIRNKKLYGALHE